MLAEEINVIGRKDIEWRKWLGGLIMTYSEPNLIALAGILTDQVAFNGIISRLWDLEIRLSSLGVEEIVVDDSNIPIIEGSNC
jgi:hypothetical protein